MGEHGPSAGATEAGRGDWALRVRLSKMLAHYAPIFDIVTLACAHIQGGPSTAPLACGSRIPKSPHFNLAPAPTIRFAWNMLYGCQTPWRN